MSSLLEDPATCHDLFAASPLRTAKRPHDGLVDRPLPGGAEEGFSGFRAHPARLLHAALFEQILRIRSHRFLLLERVVEGGLLPSRSSSYSPSRFVSNLEARDAFTASSRTLYPKYWSLPVESPAQRPQTASVVLALWNAVDRQARDSWKPQ